MNKKLFFLNIVLEISSLFFLLCIKIFYDLAKREAELHGKMYRNYMFLDEWMNKKRKDPNKIIHTLEEMNCKEVAIYGAGYLGYQLYNELRDSSIKVVYMIDNYRKESGLPVSICSMSNVPQKVDVVIISLIYGTKKIKENIQKQTGMKSLLLEELIEY